jgi:hypothetical protein
VKISAVLFASLLAMGASAVAQGRTTAPSGTNQTSSYRVTVVSRSTPAISYKHRSGATKIDFQGTDLMPGAAGEAKVESKRGALEIEAEFSGLDRPTSFGNEYLTYVLWAISPEGRPVNIGEVLVGDNHRSKLDVTTDLQAFALIVTAEPYYAVRRPSNVVVLENVIRRDTVGAAEAVDAKYELWIAAVTSPPAITSTQSYLTRDCRLNSSKRAMRCGSPSRPERRPSQAPALKTPPGR